MKDVRNTRPQNGGIIPLIPQPLDICDNSLCGKLFIEGNIEQNTIRFSFEFSGSGTVAPVVLDICAAGTTHRCYCAIRDAARPVMASPVFTPEFCVGQQFTINAVETLARFIPKKAEHFDK